MDLLPGDVGFSTIGGRTGALVNIGQSLLRDSCRFTHAWIALADGKILEAMPGGARIVDGSRRPGPAYRLPLEVSQRDSVHWDGSKLEGTPYSFADYAALAAWEWHVPGRDLLRGYVSSSGHMICSQLVDHLLCRAGFHLFTDGRLPQDVTPGDLFYRVSESGSRVL